MTLIKTRDIGPEKISTLHFLRFTTLLFLKRFFSPKSEIGTEQPLFGVMRPETKRYTQGISFS